MSAHSQKATLLIITTETSEAERLMGAMREEGLASKHVTLPHAKRLEQTITERGCDMVICCAYDRDVDTDAVIAASRKLKIDAPLILIADPEASAGDMVKARRGGVRDLVLRNDNEHLKLAVGREVADLRKRREAAGLIDRLKHCEQRSKELIEVTSAGVAFIQDGLHIEANPAYLRLFGYDSPDDVLATPFLDLVSADHQKRIKDLLRTGDSGAQTEGSRLEVDCRRLDSTQFKALLVAAQSEIDDEPCLRVIIHPLDQEGRAAEASPTSDRAGDDGGMARLLGEIESHIGEDRIVERPFTIFYIRVKKSQELLRDLGLTNALELFEGFGSKLLAAAGDQPTFLARIGDDGFGMIVDGLEEIDAKALAETIASKARLTTHVAQDANTTDCEIGYFLVRDRAAAAEDIVNAAYRLCIGHSLTGRDQPSDDTPPTSLAARGKQEETGEDDTVARKIQYALEHDQLKLVYQPIISLMGDNQENYSVLLRLLDDEENLLEAKDFIGPAIRRGLIEEIDKWAIRASIQVIGEQRKAGHNLSLFINLSEDTFRNPSIVLWICDCLREFDVRGNWLTFQFQEELVVGNLASISKLVETLKKIKCRVAINRFGITERPEILLQGLSLDFVLLKSSYAQGLADDPDKQQRLLQLATLAREFNVKSIVTGVEDARALTVLWTAGVDYVQGNFLQRPSPTLEVQA